MNLRLLFFSFFLLIFVSCNLKKEESIDETSIENEVQNNENKAVNPEVFKPLDDWKTYYHNRINDFDMANFKKQESFNLTAQKSEIVPIWSPDFNPFYKNFIRFNIDSTKYVDFMSYKLQFDEKNNLMISPDQEVVVVDLPNKKVERILFYGPSYWIEDAYFKNDSTLVLLENSNEQKPAYQEINLNTLKSDYYTYNKKVDFNSDYLKENLDNLYKVKP